MASNFCAVFFHVLATLLGWGSFAISIGSVAVADWVRFDVEPDLRIGLFESCTITTDECEPISDELVDNWAYAVRAFIILMIIFGGFGGLTGIASQVKAKVQSLRFSAMGHYLFAGTCGIIGIAIYTYNKENNNIFQTTVQNERSFYGSAYIMAWISLWGYYASGLLEGLSACCSPKYDIH